MCCGNGDGAGPSETVQMVLAAGRPADDTVYVVTYFNGVSEEAVGSDAAKRLLINPAARVEGAQSEDDFPPGTVVFGGTYSPKV